MNGQSGDDLTGNYWEEIRHRIQGAGIALEKSFKPDPEKSKNILRTRARELAKGSKKVQKGETYLEVVEFLLADEKYAFELTYIREIYPLTGFTAVPCTPPFVVGVINFRRQILSVIDLKKFLDLPDHGTSDSNRIIILNSDKMEFGILADRILGIGSIPVNAIQPSLSTGTGIRTDYLKGVTEDRLVILDAEKILSGNRILINKKIKV